MRKRLKTALVAGYNRGYLRMGFVMWCFEKFDLRSV